MQYNNVIEIHFNWHKHPEHGCDWGFFRVGETYPQFREGFAQCEEIQIDFDEGMHAIIYFDNGTTEHQWNINKIIEAEADAYNQIKKYKGSGQAPELPQPNTD